MNNLHHDHVHTDEYTQTGATLQYYNIQIMSPQQPHGQSSKNLVSKKQGRAVPGSQMHISGNLERDNKLVWRTEHHKCHKDSIGRVLRCYCPNS